TLTLMALNTTYRAANFRKNLKTKNYLFSRKFCYSQSFLPHSATFNEVPFNRRLTRIMYIDDCKMQAPAEHAHNFIKCVFGLLAVGTTIPLHAVCRCR